MADNARVAVDEPVIFFPSTIMPLIWMLQSVGGVALTVIESEQALDTFPPLSLNLALTALGPSPAGVSVTVRAAAYGSHPYQVAPPSLLNCMCVTPIVDVDDSARAAIEDWV